MLASYNVWMKAVACLTTLDRQKTGKDSNVNYKATLIDLLRTISLKMTNFPTGEYRYCVMGTTWKKTKKKKEKEKDILQAAFMFSS